MSDTNTNDIIPRNTASSKEEERLKAGVGVPGTKKKKRQIVKDFLLKSSKLKPVDSAYKTIKGTGQNLKDAANRELIDPMRWKNLKRIPEAANSLIKGDMSYSKKLREEQKNKK